MIIRISLIYNSNLKAVGSMFRIELLPYQTNMDGLTFQMHVTFGTNFCGFLYEPFKVLLSKFIAFEYLSFSNYEIIRKIW